MELKQGVLYKRGAGGFLKRKNWKRRFFQLSDSELRYFDTNSGVQKGVVKLSECDGIEALEMMPQDCPKTGKSASTSWRLAIKTRTRCFYLSATTEYELYEWAEAIKHVLARTL
ncbi:Aste57867_1594 [Aphanomyces stellatus]|uniref:Aste57867_1594 protein n=1 Tax=Aphanomyces stellatus TaxID=120398 RepID=A0A485KB09_9STRA|nr:hypothetical protein As57867_001593 [Aphanomyces stellatus]VFT78807.1 Aste57867_1594 [Aphanomyces stellatus]